MARVPYIAREELPESKRHCYDEIAGKRGRTSVGNAFGALLNSPEAAAKVGAVGGYLRFDSEIPAPIRELITCTVASEMRCEYEWRAHENLARKAGVSESSIAIIRDGKDPKDLPPNEATLVQYAQELMRTRSVSDGLFAKTLEQLGSRKNLVDLTLLIGYYMLLAHAFLALKVDSESR